MREAAAIGGYLELELGQQQETAFYGAGYHTIRSALQDIMEHLVSKGTRRRLWFPAFICPSVRQAFETTRDRIQIITYHIGSDLRPVDLKPEQNDLVYDYSPFGLAPTLQMEGALVDNAHALFKEALSGQHTFYSPRKFIGIPDGALLHSAISLHKPPAFQLDEGAAYLLRRIDQGAEAGFANFQDWEKKLYSEKILGMSAFSRKVLSQVDTKQLKARRIKNFQHLHTTLGSINALDKLINSALEQKAFVPFSYPFLHKRGVEVRQKLANHRIYTPTLWGGLTRLNDIERNLAINTIHCPVDQRYNVDSMDRVLYEINNALNV